MIEPVHFFIGAGITAAFAFGLFMAERAYNRDRRAWQAERVEKNQMINRQVEAIDELQLDKNELTAENAALQAQNRHLASQRFQLLQGGRTA